MARAKKTVIEYRNYELPLDFPVLLLTGEDWRISAVPSKRLHFHNLLEIGFCHEGSGTLALEHSALPFGAGDVTCIARNVPHTTFSSPNTTSLWSYLFLDPAALLKDFFHDTVDADSALFSMLRDCQMVLSGKQYPLLQNLLGGILREMEQRLPNYKLSVRALSVTLLMQLLRAFDAQSAPHMEAQKNLLVISPALEYVRQHYAEDFSMEALSALCHLSPTHFRRRFRELMGLSPLTMLHQTRIRECCALMSTTDKSIAQIAAQAGYYSVSSFNRHFSEVMGMSPSKWRREAAPAASHIVLEYSGWTKAEPVPPA